MMLKFDFEKQCFDVCLFAFLCMKVNVIVILLKYACAKSSPINTAYCQLLSNVSYFMMELNFDTATFWYVMYNEVSNLI